MFILPVSVLNENVFTRFESMIDFNYFENVLTFFESLEHKKFCVKETTSAIDRIYDVNNQKIRATFDKSGTKILHFTLKKNIAQLHLFLPSKKYDIRLSISIEENIKCEPSDLKRLLNERIKERVSFNLNNISFDFTKIMDSKSDTITTTIKSLELEAEIRDHKSVSMESIADFIDKLRIISQIT